MNKPALRAMNWGEVTPDVDYVKSNPAADSTNLREWEKEALTGHYKESVNLPSELSAKLRWMIPSSRDDLSFEDVLQKRKLLAAAGIFDQSPHAYMARVIREAIDRDFPVVDEHWRKSKK